MGNEPVVVGDHPTGVVFYLIDGRLVPRERVQAQIVAVAEMYINGFVVRVGYRGAQEGAYWLCFNNRDIARVYLEPYFARLAQHLGVPSVVLAKKFKLPGDGPNPTLRPVQKKEPAPRAPQSVPAPPPEPEPAPKAPQNATPPRRGHDATGFSDDAAAARQELKGKLNLSGITGRLRGATRRRKPKGDQS